MLTFCSSHDPFGNELGRILGPFSVVAVVVYEASKYIRPSTPSTALGLEMGMAGAADGWIYDRSSPEECKCLK